MKVEVLITIKVGTNFDITDVEFAKELLLAETKLNTESKLRFHIETNFIQLKEEIRRQQNGQSNE